MYTNSVDPILYPSLFSFRSVAVIAISKRPIVIVRIKHRRMPYHACMRAFLGTMPTIRCVHATLRLNQLNAQHAVTTHAHTNCGLTRTRRVPHLRPNYIIIIPYCTAPHAHLSYLVCTFCSWKTITQLANVQVFYLIIHILRHTIAFNEYTFLFHPHTQTQAIHSWRAYPNIGNMHPVGWPPRGMPTPQPQPKRCA